MLDELLWLVAANSGAGEFFFWVCDECARTLLWVRGLGQARAVPCGSLSAKTGAGRRGEVRGDADLIWCEISAIMCAILLTGLTY